MRDTLIEPHPLDPIHEAAGAQWAATPARTVLDYGDPAGEYEAIQGQVGLYDARDRGTIAIAGADRASWLNNLTTNTILNLQRGDGNYTFCLDLQGRILFDGNMLVDERVIHFDTDRAFIEQAVRHFDRYLIAEEVTLADQTPRTARLLVTGPGMADLASRIGVRQAPVMAALGSSWTTIDGCRVLAVRHDALTGRPGLDLHVRVEHAVEVWQSLMELGRDCGLRPVGRRAVEVSGIEAELARAACDFDERTRPAETGLSARAVSHVKGCYLGQEVVERMRARGVVASRQRVLLDAGEQPFPLDRPLPLQSDGRHVGRVTRAAWSCRDLRMLAMGMVRSGFARPGTELVIDDTSSRTVTVRKVLVSAD